MRSFDDISYCIGAIKGACGQMPHILIELFLYQGFSRFKAICLPSNRKSPFVDVDSVPGSLFEVGDVKLPLFDLSRSYSRSSILLQYFETMQSTLVIDDCELKYNLPLVWLIVSAEGNSFEGNDLESSRGHEVSFLKTVVLLKQQHVDLITTTSILNEINCVARAMHME